jgi:hypothetical protein
MGKPSINAKTVLAEIRSGFTPDALMKKYALSPKGLESLLRKLVSAGAIGQTELDAWKAKANELVTVADDVQVVTEGRSSIEVDEPPAAQRVDEAAPLLPKPAARTRVSRPGAPHSILTVAIDADMEVVTEGATPEEPVQPAAGPSQSRPRSKRDQSRPKSRGAAVAPQAPLSVAVSIGSDVVVVAEGMTADDSEAERAARTKARKPNGSSKSATSVGPAPRASKPGGLETIAITDGLQAVVEGSEDTLTSAREEATEVDASLPRGRSAAQSGAMGGPIQVKAPLLKGAPVVSVAAGMEVVAEGSTHFEDEEAEDTDSKSAASERRGRWSQPGPAVPRPPVIAATGLSVTDGMEIVGDGLEIVDEDASGVSASGASRAGRPLYARRRLSSATGDFEAEAHEFDGIESGDDVTRPADATERIGEEDTHGYALTEGREDEVAAKEGPEDYGDEFDEQRRARRRRSPAPLRPLPPPSDGASVRAAAQGEEADRRFAHKKRWYDYGLVVFLLMFVPFSAPLAFIHGPALFSYAYGFIYEGATAPEVDPRLFLAPFALTLLLGWFALLRNTEMAAWAKVSFVTLWLVCAPVVWFMIPRSSAAAEAIVKELNAKGDYCVARLTGWRQNILRVDFTHRTGAASRDKIVDKVRFMRNELYEDGVRYLEFPDSTGNYLRIDFETMTESLTTEKALPWFQPAQGRR